MAETLAAEVAAPPLRQAAATPQRENDGPLTIREQRTMLAKAREQAFAMFPGEDSASVVMRNQLLAKQEDIARELILDPTGESVRRSLTGGSGNSLDCYVYMVLFIGVALALKFQNGVDVDGILAGFVFWTFEPKIPEHILRGAMPWNATIPEFTDVAYLGAYDRAVRFEHYERSELRLKWLDKPLLWTFRDSTRAHKRGLASLVVNPAGMYERDGVRSTVVSVGGGHIGAESYWPLFSEGSDAVDADGALASHLEHAFGSPDDFLSSLRATALDHHGSGWVWLYLNLTSASLHIDFFRGNTIPAKLGSDVAGLLTVDMWPSAYFPASREVYLDALLPTLNWPELEKRYVDAFPEWSVRIGGAKCTAPTKARASDSTPATSQAKTLASASHILREDFEGHTTLRPEHLRTLRDIWASETTLLNEIVSKNPLHAERLRQVFSGEAARVLGEEDSEETPEDSVHESVLYLGFRHLAWTAYFDSMDPAGSPPEDWQFNVTRALATEFGAPFFIEARGFYYTAPREGWMAVCWDCSEEKPRFLHRRPLEPAEVKGCHDFWAIPLGDEVTLGISPIAAAEAYRIQFFQASWSAMIWNSMDGKFEEAKRRC